MLYKEITDSADKTNTRRPNKTNKRSQRVTKGEIRREEESGEGEEVQAGLLRAGWRCLSLEGAQLAWGCPRWLFLQTSWLWFGSDEKRKRKQHKTGLELFSSSRERSSRPSHLQGPPQNAFASSLQGDLPRSLCRQMVPFYREHWGAKGPCDSEPHRQNEIPDLRLLGHVPPPTTLPGGGRASLCCGSAWNPDLQKSPTALTVKSREQRVGVQGIASGRNPSPTPSQLVPQARHSTHAQCFQLNVMMPKALTSWSCSKRQCSPPSGLPPSLGRLLQPPGFESHPKFDRPQRASVWAPDLHSKLPPQPLPLCV